MICALDGSSMLKVLRRLCGHCSGEPSGVVDQSSARMCAPISPPPFRQSALDDGSRTTGRPSSATSGMALLSVVHGFHQSTIVGWPSSLPPSGKQSERGRVSSWYNYVTGSRLWRVRKRRASAIAGEESAAEVVERHSRDDLCAVAGAGGDRKCAADEAHTLFHADEAGSAFVLDHLSVSWASAGRSTAFAILASRTAIFSLTVTGTGAAPVGRSLTQMETIGVPREGCRRCASACPPPRGPPVRLTGFDADAAPHGLQDPDHRRHVARPVISDPVDEKGWRAVDAALDPADEVLLHAQFECMCGKVPRE